MIEKTNFDSNFPKINVSRKGRQLNFLDEINSRHNIVEESKMNLMKLGNPNNYKISKVKKPHDQTKDKKNKLVKSNINFVKVKLRNNTQNFPIINNKKSNSSLDENILDKNNKDKIRLNLLKKGILKKIKEKSTINKSLFEFSTTKIQDVNIKNES